MFNDTDLEVLAAFARHVDRNSLTREAIRRAPDLKTIVCIANEIGFDRVSVELLTQACLSLCSGEEWVWRPLGRRWSDHMFTLALVMLLKEKELDGCDSELSYFYDYLSGCGDAWREFVAARSTQEQAAVARSHGFLISKESLDTWSTKNP